MSPARTGSITLELLIAFAIFMLTLSATILVTGGSGMASLSVSADELAIAKRVLADARAASVGDFLAAVSASQERSVNGSSYESVLSVTDLTPCLKEAESKAMRQNAARDYVLLATWFADTAESDALGGDCATLPTASAWNELRRYASDSIPATAGTALDTAGGMTYIGITTPPYFAIADHIPAQPGSSSLLIPFANGFALPAYPNAVDAVLLHDAQGGTYKRYVFAALNATTSQLAVVDVTDPRNPVLVASRTPANVDPAGESPQGYRLFYYDAKLYFTTRYTAGPEFHIFDVSDPRSPREIGNGTELGTTVHDVVIRDQWVQSVRRRFAYLAAAQNTKGGELMIFDLTNPSAPTHLAASDVNFPGTQDGDSLALTGSRLYFGRQSASGPDLYVFDVSDPTKPLAQLGAADIGTSVTSMRLMGPFAYLGTAKAAKQLQVWDVEDPSHMSLRTTYALPNLPDRGFDYGDDQLYAVGKTEPFFQVIGSK